MFCDLCKSDILHTPIYGSKAFVHRAQTCDQIMEVSPSPSGLEAEYETLFTADSLHFLYELVSTFDQEVNKVRLQ